MIKFSAGFILGALMLSAMAQITDNLVPDLGAIQTDVASFFRAGGDGPDDQRHVIQVDAYGYVICSELPPPKHWLHGDDPAKRNDKHLK